VLAPVPAIDRGVHVIVAATRAVYNLDGMNLGLLILRVAVGVIMLAHGINHIFRGGKIEGTAGWFASLGMKPGILHAWLASLTELGAGAMLILGLFTPLAAAGVVGTMAVALITNHLRNGFFIFRPGEGWEYVGSLICSGLALGATGPGQWSLDHALNFGWVSGFSSFAITAAVGLGGAAVLLFIFWRPEKKAA
jgi:putative oxidoreductase